MKKLKARRRKLDRRLNRNQKWRRRILRVVKQMEKRGQKGLAKQLRKVVAHLHDRIKGINAQLANVEREIEKAKKRGEDGRKAYLKFLESIVGLAEPDHAKFANDIGAAVSWPWCSTLVAYGLIHHGGFKRDQLPSNPWYSGAWLTWEHGERVSYADRQPGDLLIFDWGDGGITDHVATYIGDGLKIGGNENDRVERDPVPSGYVVGVVRPNWPR